MAPATLRWQPTWGGIYSVPPTVNPWPLDKIFAYEDTKIRWHRLWSRLHARQRRRDREQSEWVDFGGES